MCCIYFLGGGKIFSLFKLLHNFSNSIIRKVIACIPFSLPIVCSNLGRQLDHTDFKFWIIAKQIESITFGSFSASLSIAQQINVLRGQRGRNYTQGWGVTKSSGWWQLDHHKYTLLLGLHLVVVEKLAYSSEPESHAGGDSISLAGLTLLDGSRERRQTKQPNPPPPPLLTMEAI